MAEPQLLQELFALFEASPSMKGLADEKRTEMREQLAKLPDASMRQMIDVFKKEQELLEKVEKDEQEHQLQVIALTAEVKQIQHDLGRSDLQYREKTAASGENPDDLLKNLDQKA